MACRLINLKTYSWWKRESKVNGMTDNNRTKDLEQIQQAAIDYFKLFLQDWVEEKQLNFEDQEKLLDTLVDSFIFISNNIGQHKKEQSSSIQNCLNHLRDYLSTRKGAESASNDHESRIATENGIFQSQGL